MAGVLPCPMWVTPTAKTVSTIEQATTCPPIQTARVYPTALVMLRLELFERAKLLGGTISKTACCPEADPMSVQFPMKESSRDCTGTEQKSTNT